MTLTINTKWGNEDNGRNLWCFIVILKLHKNSMAYLKRGNEMGRNWSPQSNLTGDGFNVRTYINGPAIVFSHIKNECYLKMNAI